MVRVHHLAQALKCLLGSRGIEVIMKLEIGKHYWMRHKIERIWRIVYIGVDHDSNQWVHGITAPARKIAEEDIVFFDWREILEPDRQP